MRMGVTSRCFWLSGFLLLLPGGMGRFQTACGQDSLSIVLDQTTLRVRDASGPLLRYRYGDVPYKPYVQQLFTPAGVNVLLDAPPDHLHHHALMYAITVDGVNFWEEHQQPGREGHMRWLDPRIVAEPGPTRARFVEQLEWINPQTRRTLLREERTIEVARLEPVPATLLCWQTRLRLPAGRSAATLTGAHYHGLGMRFLESMDTGGTFFTAGDETGEIVRGQERLTRSRWCAYTAAADGRPVTVAMFDHPANPRHPAWWFTMTEPFAYLSATMNLHREPLELTGAAPLVLRYGVVVADGTIPKEQIAALYQQWLAIVADDTAEAKVPGSK
ncbi:MAG: PmoA family protein [Sedimentisphaerales bacterium]|nr:PmoA family protein [Sedimentisphaerales bacterium]